ncbi:MAG TPA: mitochondrial fission ELM1 family protein [Patescibacteria group bacterium]|nr:mitochondrial fission ELM1 family protein [Patescibacteria group bacterium]
MAGERVWVLADDRPGNVAQAVGVAEALGEPFFVLDVAYTAWGEAHNLIRWSSRRGLTRECRKKLEPRWPELVIGAGRRTAPLARWFKRKFGTRLVQIMDPGWPGRAEFDLIAIPRHDESPEWANVVHSMGSCHRAVPHLLAAERALWQPRIAHLPGPYLLLVVGGTTKDYRFGADRARELVDGANRLAEALGASILATTSRRTEPEAEAVIAAGLRAPHHLHCWRPDTENPYLGFLALADAIVVTGDSMNMCSEACANGGPVYIFSPPGMVNAKHARLHELLFEQGYARPLGGDTTPWRHPPLNAAEDVARVVRERGLI